MDPEFALQAVPAGGSFMAKCIMNAGANLVYTASQVASMIDLYPNGMLSLGDSLFVLIYPESDQGKVCPRYHANYLRTSTDLVLTVQRFDPPV